MLFTADQGKHQQPSRESEELKLKLKMLREENLKLQSIGEEREHIEAQLVEAKIKSANLDLEND